MGKRSSMKSNLTMTSDSTPESDSVRTSLADISHGGGSRASRRRSGSRASHGSRGKTLRLNIEQKLGISNKGGILEHYIEGAFILASRSILVL